MSVCNAQHARNEASFLGGETSHLGNKNNQVIAYETIDFKNDSKAECPTLLKYMNDLEATLLTKEGKTESQILDNQKQFYSTILNIVRKGGDYGFKAGSFNAAKPEQEYLLSHKIKALQLVAYGPLEMVEKASRAEAAFRLAELYTQNQLASACEIFNIFNIATIAAPESVWGAKSIKSQVTLLKKQQVNPSEISLATLTRIHNGIKQYKNTESWKTAGASMLNANAHQQAKLLQARKKVAKNIAAPGSAIGNITAHQKAVVKAAAPKGSFFQRLISAH